MTQTENLDIQYELNAMVSPGTSQDEVDSHFAQIVSTARQIDLQGGRIADLTIQREELLEPFTVNPYQSVIDEIGLLSQLSEARSITYDRSDRRIAAFVTRNVVGKGIDAIYNTVTTPRSQSLLIETRLQGQLDMPCILSTFGGKLSIRSQYYARSRVHTIQESLEPGENGDRLYRAFIGSTVWAAHLAITRSSEERQAADAEAHKLVIADMRSY